MSDHLDRLHDLHRDVIDLRQQLHARAALLHTAVAEALADDVRAADIAGRLGVTVGRIYQLANKAAT